MAKDDNCRFWCKKKRIFLSHADAGECGKPGVAGAASEHPLEGEAKDPLGRDKSAMPERSPA